MGKLFNSINKGFSRIFRVLLFVLSAFLIIYFFPKSGKFKYNFENGRPWQSENLYAPFDFAIKKSKEEIDDEITQAKINTPLFFEIDTSLITNSNNLLITQIDELKNDSLFSLLKGEDVKNIKIQSYQIIDAIYSKGLGWITTVIFTLLGGLFAIRSGVIKAMFLSGILMASTNLLFSLLAWSGKSELLFAIAVIFDDMAAAFATVAFVAFISMLVDRTYTATQYALLASIGTAGRTTLAASSGALVDWLNGDWGIFFIITAIMVIPSLIFLYMIKDKLKLND